MADVRARVIVVNSDNESGVGIEVYEPIIYVNKVHYIASIYVDSVISKAEGIVIAIEQLRKEYGADVKLFIKSRHTTLKRWIPVEGVRVRVEPRSNYTDTLALGEGALRRGDTIIERL